MKNDITEPLHDYVTAVLKQGAELVSAGRESARTEEDTARQTAAILAELKKRGNSN